MNNTPTPHNSAVKGDFAKTVLMPGDPLRAKYIAETYLENVRQVNGVRNMLGFTGTYKGKEISVMAVSYTHLTYDLTAGGVDIAPSQDLLPDDVKAAVEDVKKKIIDGEITVPASQEEFEAAYGDVYQLDLDKQKE